MKNYSMVLVPALNSRCVPMSNISIKLNASFYLPLVHTARNMEEIKRMICVFPSVPSKMRCARRQVASKCKDVLIELRDVETMLPKYLDQDVIRSEISGHHDLDTIKPLVSELPNSLKTIVHEITKANAKLSSESRHTFLLFSSLLVFLFDNLLWYRWEEVAVLSQVVVKALFLVSKLDLPDAFCEAFFHFLLDGDGADFPGLNFYLTYGEKVSSIHILSNPFSELFFFHSLR